MRGTPSLGDECDDDDGAETQRDDDDGDGDDAGIDLRSISYIFWNQFVYFRSLCVSRICVTRARSRMSHRADEKRPEKTPQKTLEKRRRVR